MKDRKCNILRNIIFILMKLNKLKCLYCGSCVGSCPVNAIFLAETYPIFDKEKCIECGICEKVCPVGAISEGWDEQ